jgi:hypothetical protein
MLLEILIRTPAWVYGLFIVLVVFGLIQTRTSKVGTARAVVLPIAMLILSAYGAVSVFGANPIVAAAWFVGLATALVIGRNLLDWPSGVVRDADSGSIVVPGSWTPLALMMAIFFTKFGVGVTLAMAPLVKTQPTFWVPVCLAYGLFGGLFLSRGMKILRAPA